MCIDGCGEKETPLGEKETPPGEKETPPDEKATILLMLSLLWQLLSQEGRALEARDHRRKPGGSDVARWGGGTAAGLGGGL